MTTKVEPTVEKWERCFEIDLEDGSKMIITSKSSSSLMISMSYKQLWRMMNCAAEQAVASSLQEAKAEERERLRDRCEDLKWDVKGVDNGYWWTRGEQVSKIDVYQEAMSDIQAELSALNTKASLKQEEVQDEK